MTIGDRVLAGDRRAASRLISLIEDGHPAVDDVLAELFRHTGRAVVVGVTGPPGAGKSTLVERLVLQWRSRGNTVAVLAVDPSSPFTGGAILGDRVRMASLTADPGVFVRSMASRSQLGGLAAATPAAVRVLDALGVDVIVVETVGVGQSEVAIADAADATVLVTMPGGGDGIQAMKAGVLEIGDVFVVNKSDRDGALRTQRELIAMLRFGDRRPPVLLTRADTGEGIAPVVDAVTAVLDSLATSGELQRRRLAQLRLEAFELIGHQARRQAVDRLGGAALADLEDALRERRLDPATVAARVLATLTS